MGIEGIGTAASYNNMQTVTPQTSSPQTGSTYTSASASVAAAAAVKTASVTDTAGKSKVYRAKGEEANLGRTDIEKNVAKPERTEEELRKAVERLNNAMSKTECRYSLHEDTNRIMISILDKETKDVIKEFPAEEALDRISEALEVAGLIVDEKL